MMLECYDAVIVPEVASLLLILVSHLLSAALHHCFCRWQIQGDIPCSVKRTPAKAGLLSPRKTMSCLRSASFP